MKTIFGKLCKFFYHDTYEPESHKWTWSHLAGAPFIRLVADEARFPTHCGDSLSRVYQLRYLLEESGRGKLIQKLTDGNQTYGFLADQGIVSGWLDKADGFFKLNVPDEAANYEICHQMYYDFMQNRCFGIRVDCKTDYVTYKILPDCGILIYNYIADNGSWVWCPIDPNTGQFKKSNTIRPSVKFPPDPSHPNGYYPTPEPIWLNNQFYTCVTVENGPVNGVMTYLSYIETWTPQSDGTLLHSSETVPSVYINDYRPYRHFSIATIIAMSPPMQFGGRTMRYCAFRHYDGGYYHNLYGWYSGGDMFDLGGAIGVGTFIPISGIGMRDYSIEYPVRQLWSYTAADFGVHQLSLYNHNVEWIIAAAITLNDPASEEAYAIKYEYILIRKSDGAIVNRIVAYDASIGETDYAYGYPAFNNGIPFFAWVDSTTHRAKAMNMNGGSTYAYRDFYRYGYIPSSAYGASKINSWPGYYGWSSGGHSQPTTYISAGNVFHLSISDNSIIISQSTITDLSTSCPANNYKASCSYKIVRKGNHAPVKDAQVLIKVIAEEILGSVKFEYTWTKTSDLQGMVYAEMPDCVLGANYLDFRICFEALDVIPPSLDENGTAVEWFYAPAQNEAEEKLCVTHPATSLCCGMTPPKGTMSSVSAPYNYGGVWYSIMTCQAWSNPAAGRKPNNTCGCTQYRFVCQEDDTKSTGWRDIYNLAGQNDPTGAQAVPTTYWWVNPSRLRYHWAVQYRPCQCEQIGERSDWMAG